MEDNTMYTFLGGLMATALAFVVVGGINLIAAWILNDFLKWPKRGVFLTMTILEFVCAVLVLLGD